MYSCHLVVVYKDRTEIVSNPTNFPDVIDVTSRVKEVQEPIVKATIIVPEGAYSSSHRIHMKLICHACRRIFGRDDGLVLFASLWRAGL
jgi:translation elongation factor EF-4